MTRPVQGTLFGEALEAPQVLLPPALSLWRPWPRAILEADKLIENRDWRPSRPLPFWMLLHATSKWDTEAQFSSLRERLVGRLPMDPNQHPVGLVGVARVVDVVRPEQVFGEQAAWAVGAWCWRLADVKPLPTPIPCAGSRSLWDPASVLSTEQLGALARQLEALGVLSKQVPT